MLEELRGHVRTIDSQPVMPMPDLDAYDEVFAPKPRGDAP
jgi:hypothetical protein